MQDRKDEIFRKRERDSEDQKEGIKTAKAAGTKR